MAPQTWHSVRLLLVEADIYGYAYLKEEIKKLRLKIKLRKLRELRESEALSAERKQRNKEKIKRDLTKTREILRALKDGLNDKNSCIKESLGRLREKYVTLIEVGDVFALRKVQYFMGDTRGDMREYKLYFEIGWSVNPSELHLMSLFMQEFFNVNFVYKEILYFLSADNAGQAGEKHYEDLRYGHKYSRYDEEKALRDSESARVQKEGVSRVTWQQLRYHLVEYGMLRCKMLEATKVLKTLKLKKMKFGLHDASATATYETAKGTYKTTKEECAGKKDSILRLLRLAKLSPWIAILDTFDIHAIKRLQFWMPNDERICFEIGSVSGSVLQLITDFAFTKWKILLRPRTLYSVVAKKVGEADLACCVDVGYPYTPGRIGIPALLETAHNGSN